MPLALSGTETWNYYLRTDWPKGDDGKPPADAPCIVLRHLTGRQQRELAAALDKFEKLPEDAASVEYVDACFGLARAAGIVGWNFCDRQGCRVPTTAELEDVLQFQEAREVAYAAWRGAITPGDLGNSASPSSTDSDSSARADARPA
jgi:hypothetical protein